DRIKVKTEARLNTGHFSFHPGQKAKKDKLKK
ncbi:DUF2197 domain-containing protein, partial [Bacillus amyloliquefaciens]|nr:DUF2197 domain-containing protein [Bacillus amyloliquefaciens]